MEKDAMSEYDLPKGACLACGHGVDAASDFATHPRKPKPGDITICVACGHLMGFNPDLTLRELNTAEAHMAAGDPLILRLQRLRVQARVTKNGQRH